MERLICDNIPINGYLIWQLFWINKFFVEVWFNPEEVCINKIRGIKSERFLEPLLDEINVEL